MLMFLLRKLLGQHPVVYMDAVYIAPDTGVILTLPVEYCQKCDAFSPESISLMRQASMSIQRTPVFNPLPM